MATTSPVILILGSGARIGQNVAKTFAAKGYKVALASRKQDESKSTKDQLNISSDLGNPDAVIDVFSKVKASLGNPSVVVYNAAAVTQSPPKDPLALKLTDFARDLTLNVTSAFVAAQQAALGFEQLDKSASRTFIYTGNALNEMIIPPLMDLGVGKSATAHVIRVAAAAYAEKGFK